ncbi:transposase [Bradyrhizobium sp. RDI18]|uniref:transposase n=1 Tax=Bradyrhizobium sp. RDI18 TaxID=3367400 RepID=UPI00371F8E33
MAILHAAVAHLLFLPPYSSDLNPVEQVFANLKHLIRAVEPRCRGMWQVIYRCSCGLPEPLLFEFRHWPSSFRH